MLNIKLIEKQQEIEKKTNKNQCLKKTIECFKDESFDKLFEENNLDSKLCYFILAQLYLHKRMLPESLIGICKNQVDNLQEASDAIEKLNNLGLIGWNGIQCITQHEMSEEDKKEMEQFQYPLPLLIPPKRVKDNRHNGYWFCSKGSMILKNNHTDDDICLDVINKANSIPLKINPKTMVMVHNQWKDCDHKKEGETDEEFSLRRRQFDLFNERANKAMSWILSEGNKFWLTHKYDKRGRMYDQAYLISTQGTDYQKAVVEFYKGEYLDE